MPATSEKQARFMRAVAHDKAFAEKVGVSQSVGREFSDEGSLKRTYAKGKRKGRKRAIREMMGK